jgi:hypothetical protein
MKNFPYKEKLNQNVYQLIDQKNTKFLKYFFRSYQWESFLFSVLPSPNNPQLVIDLTGYLGSFFTFEKENLISPPFQIILYLSKYLEHDDSYFHVCNEQNIYDLKKILILSNTFIVKKLDLLTFDKCWIDE